MKIVKKINNNVALAQDRNGQELVVFGRGVGFPPTPYELEDLSGIKRTFYNVKNNYLALLKDIPEKIVLLSSDIVELAKNRLGCELNPNVPFTLADHLNFAIERASKNILVNTPLSYDVENLYPREVEIGRQALELLEKQLHVRLPDTEKINIALHLINAETETGDMHITMLSTGIIRDVTEIVEKDLNIQLDKASFSYCRFAMHLRYLINRIMEGTQETGNIGAMLCQFQKEENDVYTCTQHVMRYFSEKWSWDCSGDEIFYLFIHIHRVQQSSRTGSKSDENRI